MYSQIKKIKVKDFRILGDAEVSFEESPIIALTGDNESGKTSIIKAFSVCAMNAYPTKQKDYIKTGSKGFDVRIELEDGTEITRLKALTYNRLLITKNGDVTFAADKIDRGEGVPIELEKEMGIVIEPETKEILQIRTYENKLLFIETPTSTNYKVVYDALKVDNLVRAISTGNKEINALKSNINTANNAIEVLKEQLNTLIYYNVDPLLKIKERLNKELKLINKLGELAEKVSLLTKLKTEQKNLMALLEMEPVNTGVFSKFKSLCKDIALASKDISLYEDIQDIDPINSRILGNISKLIELSNLTYPDYSGIDTFRAIPDGKYQKFGRLLDLMHSLKPVPEIEAEAVDEGTAEKFSKLISLFDRASTLEGTLADLESSMDETAEKIKAEAEEQNINYRICPNCGEVIVIE